MTVPNLSQASIVLIEKQVKRKAMRDYILTLYKADVRLGWGITDVLLEVKNNKKSKKDERPSHSQLELQEAPKAASSRQSEVLQLT